mgnify:CR=1 FL=1|tara:strand:+ start:3784 stop:3930 length:147 start_codon:yes stop_codon:yes gene_type:complete
MLEFFENAAMALMLTALGIAVLGNFFLPIFLRHNDKINEELEDDVPPN